MEGRAANVKLKVRTLGSVYKQPRVNELILFQSCSNSVSFLPVTDLKITCTVAISAGWSGFRGVFFSKHRMNFIIIPTMGRLISVPTHFKNM